MIAGPANPPRLPIELIVAMPAAAADPDRNIVGIAQSGGFAELMPILTSVSAATTDTQDPAAAAAMQAATTCQVRSFVLSEWRAQITIATRATVGGTAFRNPTCNIDRPNSLMICGAQMPRVF